MNILRKIYNRFYWEFDKRFWKHFFIVYRLFVSHKRKQIQKKREITVLFVIAELASWKTESLYVAMLGHERFRPILGVTTSMEVKGSKSLLISYIKGKGYSYVDLDQHSKSINQIKPDIIFYYKPYDGSYPRCHIFKKHLKSVPCFVHYAFTSMNTIQHTYYPICSYSLYHFVENGIVKDCLVKLVGKRRSKNIRITGIPMQDSLCSPSIYHADPWNKQSLNKKRIIYAPHHSFKGTNGKGIEYATFLDFGRFMLEMAEKYKKQVFFAFKPHPTLYPKLLKLWGQQKTDDYYEKWTKLDNTQYTPGEYTGLFKYSDAMIHDCCSFQVEYLFTNKPVMFLEGDGFSSVDQNTFGQTAHKMHYIGKCKEDIETFIINVIDECDPKKVEREDFYNNYLVPPNGNTASVNIINAILGE